MSTPVVLKQGHKVGPGRFTLIKELGRGGMGVVWLAHDTHLNEQVALKFLPPEIAADPVALNDLRRETVRSHRLTHPNIIRIHDFHQQPDGLAFVSMEFVDGQTLSGWRLQQPKQVLAWEQLAPLVPQLCTALDYAHGEGVIHRDLKPANVMLDDRGRVKLADFGIAAVVTDSMSRVSARSSTGGTLAYMSPQQLSGKRPTVADDIYALGASLYELLTGRPPFFSGDLTHQILNVPATPVSERMLELGVDGTVPPAVGALLMACLSKEADLRPQSAGMVATWVGLLEAPSNTEAQFAEVQSKVTHEKSPRSAGIAGGQPGIQACAARVKRLVAWAGAVALIGLAGWLAWNGRHSKMHMSSREHFVRWTNSLGMVFVPVPGTEVKFCIWETRVQDFEAFVKASGIQVGQRMFGHRRDGWKEREGEGWRNSGFPQTGTHPVVGINWSEAQAFCAWLTEKEREVGTLDQTQVYRLPTDAEWSSAVGHAKYPWGDQWPPPKAAGNYGGVETSKESFPPGIPILTGYRDGFARTAPVGSFAPNDYGIYDLGGNVWEWCDDWYRKEANARELLQAFPDLQADGGGRTYRVYRGGGWNDSHPQVLLSENRMGDGYADPAMRYDNTGFRVVLAGKAVAASNARSTQDGLAPPLTNSLGMVFVPVPGTEVKFCIWETRVRDFEKFVDATSRDMNPPMTDIPGGGPASKGSYTWRSPGFPQTGDHPAVGVTWHDARAFCAWLTSQEQLAGTLPRDQAYRLPTDAEWSRAAGPGEYPWGGALPPPAKAGNYASEEFKQVSGDSKLVVITNYFDGFAFTAPVGSYAPNLHGLFDLSGNVWEWCEDVYRPEMNTVEARRKYRPLDDPGQTRKGNRVLRGAAWFNEHTWIDMLRCSFHHVHEADARDSRVGFRVVLGPMLTASASAPADRGASTVTFRTAENAPAQFDAWSLLWKVPARDAGANLSYVVLQPDGQSYYVFDMSRRAAGSVSRSDFSSGFAGGDPRVFFGKPIRFAVKASQGALLFDPSFNSSFAFYRAGPDGRWDRDKPFRTISAVKEP